MAREATTRERKRCHTRRLRRLNPVSGCARFRYFSATFETRGVLRDCDGAAAVPCAGRSKNNLVRHVDELGMDLAIVN